MGDGWGLVVSGSQRFGRFLPFLRYGYSDGDETGLTPIKHLVNAGVTIDKVFGQNNDRFGIGLTWSRPVDKLLDDQTTLDAFYRVQVTPRIVVSPTLQLIFDSVRNPDENQVWVLGVRSRFAFLCVALAVSVSILAFEKPATIFMQEPERLATSSNLSANAFSNPPTLGGGGCQERLWSIGVQRRADVQT